MDVFNLWQLQRTALEYGEVSYDSFETLPMLKQAVRCPDCQGHAAFNADMDELKVRMGGDPCDEKTYLPTHPDKEGV